MHPYEQQCGTINCIHDGARAQHTIRATVMPREREQRAEQRWRTFTVRCSGPCGGPHTCDASCACTRALSVSFRTVWHRNDRDGVSSSAFERHARSAHVSLNLLYMLINEIRWSRVCEQSISFLIHCRSVKDARIHTRANTLLTALGTDNVRPIWCARHTLTHTVDTLC